MGGVFPWRYESSSFFHSRNYTAVIVSRSVGEIHACLITYTAEPLSVEGDMQVEVRYGSYTVIHDLHVVTGHGPTLLGWDWLQRLRLDCKSLGVAYIQEKPLALQPLLQKYTAAFTEKLGTMKEFSTKLAVRAGARHIFIVHAQCPMH